MAIVKIFGSRDPNVPNASTYSVYRGGTENATTAYDGSVEKPATNIGIGEEVNVEDANEYDVVFADGNGNTISKWIGYRTNDAENFCSLAMLEPNGESYEVRTFRGRKPAFGGLVESDAVASIVKVAAMPENPDPNTLYLVVEEEPATASETEEE